MPDVTPATLTAQQIREWYESTEKHLRHEIRMRDALGRAMGPTYREPTAEETREAREFVADAINARRAKETP